MQRLALSAVALAAAILAGPIAATADNKPTVADAITLLKTGHYAIAADDFEALVNDDKRNGFLLTLLGKAYLGVADRTEGKARTNALKNAKKALDSAARYEKKDEEIPALRVDVRVDLNDKSGAAKYLADGIETFGRTALMLRAQGRVQHMRKEYDDAQSSFRSSISLKDDPITRVRLAEVLVDVEQFEAAFDEYLVVGATDPALQPRVIGPVTALIRKLPLPRIKELETACTRTGEGMTVVRPPFENWGGWGPFEFGTEKAQFSKRIDAFSETFGGMGGTSDGMLGFSFHYFDPKVTRSDSKGGNIRGDDARGMATLLCGFDKRAVHATPLRTDLKVDASPVETTIGGRKAWLWRMFDASSSSAPNNDYDGIHYVIDTKAKVYHVEIKLPRGQYANWMPVIEYVMSRLKFESE